MTSKQLIFTIMTIQLSIVTWVDIYQRKISNYWMLVNLILGISLHLWLPELYPWSWTLLGYLTGWFVIGFSFFYVGIMGAGDSKYLASLFLITPTLLRWEFLEKIVYSTLVFAMIMLMITMVRNFAKFKAFFFTGAWHGFKQLMGNKFSYAPVILLAWLVSGLLWI